MNYLLLLPIIIPIIAGALVVFLKCFDNDRSRNIFTAAALIVNLAVSAFCCFGIDETLTLWKLTDKISLVLKPDTITVVFSLLMSFMFLTVGIYAFDYMKHENDKRRFFGFFLMVAGVLNGIYFADNLVTMYVFYELMTLLSLPLVLHNLTKEAISAGLKYLYYSVGGAFLSLVSIFFIYQYADSYEFKAGGFIDLSKLTGHEGAMLVIVFLAIIGFGCKAGLFPMHDWLPTAHPVAPAPASAVLSGVITKSGVIAIIRLVFFSVGADFLRGTWVQYAWAGVALLTVFMGSMLAYRETVFKRRLALSTVSQVSYVLFGLSMLNGAGFMGAILHVVFHSVIKDDLFLVSGCVIHNTGITDVTKLKGIGRRMPVTIWCFTFASLALVGIPPLSGFVSKWFLASGALETELCVIKYLGPAILLISALLTAGYLLKISVDGFFPGNDFKLVAADKCEPGALSLVPVFVLAALALLLGIFPGFLENFITPVIEALGI